jgi:hypothetical protein
MPEGIHIPPAKTKKPLITLHKNKEASVVSTRRTLLAFAAGEFASFDNSSDSVFLSGHQDRLTRPPCHSIDASNH